jgi:SAM-dependent methyltransferase
MLAVAREHAPTTGAPVEWRQGDAASLPCSSSEFDVVICQQGLQFVADKSAALREMHRVLKPGGLVAICVWRSVEHSPCHLAIAEALGRHVSEDVAKRFQAPFSFGDPGVLTALMTEAGFCDLQLRVDVVRRRLLPPEESVPGLLASTPVGAEIAILDERTRDAIVSDVATALSGYREEDGSLFVPQPTWIASARRP